MDVTLEIRLVGSPTAVRDGEPIELRGQKGWLLLALVLLSSEPLTRHRLCEILFADAVDPAGALRWNLSHLRRSLGLEVEGDPVTVTIPDDALVDALAVRTGDAATAAALPHLDAELLAGITAPTIALEVWLEDERRYNRQLVSDIRHEAALSRLGAGDSAGAVALARRVLRASPLDENAAALLVRCLRSDGRADEAREVAADVATRLREELWVEPTEVLWSALASPPGGERRATGHGAVVAQLEAGRSALTAGAVESGLGALRSATVAARALGDGYLVASCLVELGSGLIHAVRGVDQDGLALMHEALPLAEAHGADDLLTTAMREIGYVDMLRARYERALRWFERARVPAGEDPERHAWIALYDGAVRSDIGDVDGAWTCLGEALDTASTLGDLRLEAFTRTFRGRLALTEGDPDAALAELERSGDGARAISWTSFLGFPESLLAEALRTRGQLADARVVAQRALAVSEQVSDPCWESLSLRSLGLVSIDEGRIDEGIELLTEAPPRCRRLPDTYLWIEAFALDALASTAVGRGLAGAEGWTEQLATMAATHGMSPLRARAQRYRSGVTD